MNRAAILILAGLLGPGLAYAQTSAGAQAGASTQSQAGANVQTPKSGVQASGNDSTSAQTNASAQAEKKSVSLADGTTMNAALAGSLDAKKNKPGDKIEARTTQDVKQNGKVVLPKGTRLVGQVTQAQAREKGQAESQLGVVFDHAELRNGEQVPVNVAVQALAASQSAVQGSAGDDELIASGAGAATSSAGSGGGRLIGGTLGGATNTVGGVAGGVGNTAGGAVGSTVNTAAHSTGAVGGVSGTGALTSNSRGVFGLEGLSLNSAASSATQGSMIVSSTRNVHLDSGTQMVLRVAGQAR
jgi:hypothetical protein